MRRLGALLDEPRTRATIARPPAAQRDSTLLGLVGRCSTGIVASADLVFLLSVGRALMP